MWSEENVWMEGNREGAVKGGSFRSRLGMGQKAEAADSGRRMGVRFGGAEMEELQSIAATG